MKHLGDKAMHLFDSTKEEAGDLADSAKTHVKDAGNKIGEVFITFFHFDKL